MFSIDYLSCETYGSKAFWPSIVVARTRNPWLIGTIRSDDGDGDGNGNATKAIGLISKTTILHVHHDFLYISLPSLHDYDVKMPNFKMYKSDGEVSSLFLNLDMVLRNSTLGGFAYI